MSLTSKIAYNTLILGVGKIFSIFLGLIVVALMTRYLGQEGYGYYTTIIAYLQIFGILVDLGLNVIVVQMISEPQVDRRQEQKIISNIFTIRFFSALMFFLLSAGLICFFPYSNLVKIGVFWALLSFFCISLIQILSGLYQKHLKMTVVSVAEIAGRILLLGLTLLVIHYQLSLLAIMLSVSLGSLLNFIIVFAFSRQINKIKFAFDFAFWKKILSKSWPIALSISLNMIYLKSDTLILSLFKSPEEVGIYGAAYRVLDIITMFPHLFMGLVLPLLAASWLEKNKEKFKQRLQKAFDFFTIFAAPMIIGTLFLSEKIMVFVAGRSFAPSALPLEILIFAAAAILFGTLFSYTVVAIDKQKTMLWGFLATAITSLVGYLIFIPKYSYVGAAGVTVYSEILISIIGAYIVYQTIKTKPKLILFKKSLLAGLVMGVCLYFSSNFNLILQILIAIFSYFIVMYLVRGISKQSIYELIGKRA